MNKYSHTQNHTDLSTGNLRDHFLIAMPGMHGTSFAQSLIYLCDHNESGAMGLTLNHSMPLTLGNIFTQLGLPDSAELGAQAVLAGGPVQTERGFVLHTGSSQWQSSLRVTQDINLTVSRDILEALSEGRGPQEFLLALGYAGWGAGQLEEEIAANAWLTLPADKHILFQTPVEQRWSAATHHLGFDFNLISTTVGHA